MRGRSLTLDETSITLPRGTRVVLRVDVPGEDGYVHRAASPAVVREVTYETYALETPSGRRFSAQRDQITVPRRDLLDDLGLSQWDHRRLRDHAIFTAVVGSQAWGLAGPHSDEDVRGCFVAPFEATAGLWRVPEEIHDPSNDEALWEIGKLVHQGLRGDANTLETLWSPLRRIVTPLGERLLAEREMFVSMNVLGSFGRYAQSQFTKIERSLARDEVLRALLDGAASGAVTDEPSARAHLDAAVGHRGEAEWRAELKAVLRSLIDRGLLEQGGLPPLLEAVAAGRRAELEPAPHRPKNAYNLLRLLHSCVHWLEHGAPLIEVQGELRETLLGIKDRRTPIERTLELARAAALEVEAAAKVSRLPEAPNYEAADALLRECRRAAARVSLAAGPMVDAVTLPGPTAAESWFALERLPVALPPDVDIGVLGRFFDRYLDAGPPVVGLALSGAHAYGFPSPDSDLDLKGVHVTGARALLRIAGGAKSVDVLEDFEGREHDYTTNDLGTSMKLLLAGNGNLIERFLGPFPLVYTRAGRRLAELAQASLSRRCYGHYRGFMGGVLREYAREAEGGVKKAKRLLYGFRVGLTGLHLLLSGELVTNARTLAPEYGFAAEVEELFVIKKSAEAAQVGADAGFLSSLARLEAKLEAAVEGSALPAEPSHVDAIEACVVELRLAAG